MADCLYILKIAMLRNQFRMIARVRNAVLALAEFIVLIYGLYFLQTPLAISAPRLDRKFYEDVVSWQELYARRSLQWKIAEAAKKSFFRHMWYLTPQCVVFGIFDEDLASAERGAMSRVLRNTPRPQQWTVGKPTVPVNHLLVNPQACLSLFIGPKSWLLWRKLGEDDRWLSLPVEQWAAQDAYINMRKFLSKLLVVNDTAER